MASSKGKSKTAKATTAKTARAKTTKVKSGKAPSARARTAKTAVKKAVKKAARKTVKTAVKAAVRKTAKKAVKKTVKTAVKKIVKKAARKATASKPEQNRRRFDRRDTRIKAELEHDGRLTAGTVTNLSLAGCLFEPRLDIAVGSRVKLKLAGEAKPVSATVKGVSDRGLHCLLHAGGVTLGNLAADLDDMALLMLNAGRPHEIAPPAAKRGK
jgi:hypothetical protein